MQARKQEEEIVKALAEYEKEKDQEDQQVEEAQEQPGTPPAPEPKDEAVA